MRSGHLPVARGRRTKSTPVFLAGISGDLGAVVVDREKAQMPRSVTVVTGPCGYQEDSSIAQTVEPTELPGRMRAGVAPGRPFAQVDATGFGAFQSGPPWERGN